MIKELLLIGTTVFAIASGGISAATNIQYPERPERGNHVSLSTLQMLEIKKQDAINQAKLEKLIENGVQVTQALEKLSTHVDKTWYVFSGATPSGWDCSGLTMWFYEQLGITVEHRASVQDTAGIKTNDPKPGDLVVFKYNGSKQAYHVGIYVGDGKMIHAPKHGHLTRIENIKKFGGSYSKISYRKLIDTNL